MDLFFSFFSLSHSPSPCAGNMWSQSWLNILDLVLPYEGEPSIDVTPVLQREVLLPIKKV